MIVSRSFAVFDIGAMLCRDHDVFDFDRLAVAIFDGHLGFAVGPEKISFAAFANFREIVNQAMRHLNRERHQLRRFIAGIAEHHALIAGALFLVQPFAFGNALRNIRRLLLDRGKNRAGVAVESHGGIGVTDIAHHFADDIDVRHLGPAGNFAGNDDHAGLRQALAGDSAVRDPRPNERRESRPTPGRKAYRDDLPKPIPT